MNTNGRAEIAKVSDRWYKVDRLGGLRRFALAITVLNILGHTWFGFEQSWAQPLVGLAAAYGMELALEFYDCWMQRRKPRFLAGGKQQFVDFFLPAHISGLACSMLLYSNDRLAPIALAAAAAIASKHVFRLQTENGSRHFFERNLSHQLTKTGEQFLTNGLSCFGGHISQSGASASRCDDETAPQTVGKSPQFFGNFLVIIRDKARNWFPNAIQHFLQIL